MLHLGFYVENRHLHLRNTRDTSLSAESGLCNVSPELSFPYLTFIAVQLLSHVQLFEIPWLYGLKHTRLPCPSPSRRVCSNSCPLSQWCHPTISSSVALSPPALKYSTLLGAKASLCYMAFAEMFAARGPCLGLLSLPVWLTAHSQTCLSRV